MLQNIKNWLLNKALLIALGTSSLIAILSLMNTEYMPDTGIIVSDKLLHVFAYLVLMWSWLLVLRNNNSFKNVLLLLFILAIYGIILELLQGNIAINRTLDWKDVIANILGLLLGLLSFKSLYKRVFK